MAFGCCGTLPSHRERDAPSDRGTRGSSAHFERELQPPIVDWYNEHRPHMTFSGKTPNEVYFSRSPANEQPPSNRVAIGHAGRSLCETTSGHGRRVLAIHVIIEIDCHEGRRHLPIVRTRHAA